VFAQLEQMHADLAPYASGLNSQVTVFANTNAINCFLPEDLSGFLQANPVVRVSLEEQPSPSILRAVIASQVDIGVVAADAPVPGIEALPYRQDRLVVILPAGHPLAGRKSLSFTEVLDQPFVALHAGSAIHTFMMNHAAQLGARLDVRIQVRSFSAVCRMVAAGVGIGLVPKAALSLDVSGSAMVEVTIEEAWAERNLCLCVRAGMQLPPAASLLLAHLAAVGNVAP
jgi:DNA-binding transcriptional LysR family regulator